jgi:hypothetical protein
MPEAPKRGTVMPGREALVGKDQPCIKATIREFTFCLASLKTPERFKE